MGRLLIKYDNLVDGLNQLPETLEELERLQSEQYNSAKSGNKKTEHPEPTIKLEARFVPNHRNT